MEQGRAPHEVASGGAGEGNQVAAAAARRPGERSNRPTRPQTQIVSSPAKKSRARRPLKAFSDRGWTPSTPGFVTAAARVESWNQSREVLPIKKITYQERIGEDFAPVAVPVIPPRESRWRASQITSRCETASSRTPPLNTSQHQKGRDEQPRDEYGAESRLNTYLRASRSPQDCRSM